MSCFDYRKEEWTRRKSYLLRSLFEDDPLLSTISEEDESGVQYSPKTPSGHYRARHYETRYRSPSPLPDLVVEVVSRRPKIYDDEPEEYYKRLEKQMRKLYRRDYLNLPSSSSDSTHPQSENESHTFEEDYCVRDSIDQEKSLQDDYNMNLITEDEVVYIVEPHGLSPITEESSIIKSTSSMSIGENQIETTAIIEKEMEQSDDNSKESIHTCEASTIRSSAEAEESSEEGESEGERDEEPTELAENNGASLNNESVSPILEPDAMRRQEVRSSRFSIGNDFEKSTEKIVPYHRKQLEFMEESLENCDTNITSRVTDITGKATSTPNSSHKSYTFRLSKRKSFGDRYKPYSSSSSGKSFVSKYDQALQTSFSEEQTSNQDFWRNFIVGTPIIYMFQ
ncbi:uncharacterized protein LOC121740503 isoform X2 [Aricia agestis]|uniref:uncharacterized protein LOC121740503 isoform X2 n=1 Tax=Aricia agestis TaxID=91739 RepID=UPI001C203AD5|nr:uncharacterized protein LOC121740503 isoform X2 [Aricia agestis]